MKTSAEKSMGGIVAQGHYPRQRGRARVGDLITRIRALDHRKDVPVVMMTGTVDVPVVAAALAAGANGVVYKPVDMVLLVATVSKCVEERRRHQVDT